MINYEITVKFKDGGNEVKMLTHSALELEKVLEPFSKASACYFDEETSFKITVKPIFLEDKLPFEEV